MWKLDVILFKNWKSTGVMVLQTFFKNKSKHKIIIERAESYSTMQVFL